VGFPNTWWVCGCLFFGPSLCFFVGVGFCFCGCLGDGVRKPCRTLGPVGIQLNGRGVTLRKAKNGTSTPTPPTDKPKKKKDQRSPQEKKGLYMFPPLSNTKKRKKSSRTKNGKKEPSRPRKNHFFTPCFKVPILAPRPQTEGKKGEGVGQNPGCWGGPFDPIPAPKDTKKCFPIVMKNTEFVCRLSP